MNNNSFKLHSGNRRKLLLSAGGLAALSTPLAAFAQTLNKTARMVVGFPAGGIDVTARALVDRMQPFYPAGLIVDSRSGASGRLAIDNVKTSPADGSAILFTGDFTLTIYPHSFKRLGYDPVKDFTPISTVSKSQLALSVGPLVPSDVTTVAQYIAWCKANPKKASYGAAPGSTPHLVGHMFRVAAGTEIVQVPYKGGGPALQDLMAGQVSNSFNAVGEVLPFVGTNKLRVLATTGPKRSRFLPDVPTMTELGFKDFVYEVWLGVLLPANAPASVVTSTFNAVNEALKRPDLAETFSKLGVDVMPGSPETMAALIKSDIERWAPIVKASGFTADE